MLELFGTSYLKWQTKILFQNSEAGVAGGGGGGREIIKFNGFPEEAKWSFSYLTEKPDNDV